MYTVREREGKCKGTQANNNIGPEASFDPVKRGLVQ